MSDASSEFILLLVAFCWLCAQRQFIMYSLYAVLQRIHISLHALMSYIYVLSC